MKKLDKKISYYPHNNKNNAAIFRILESESNEFYHFINLQKPKSIIEINNYFLTERDYFDVFLDDIIVGIVERNRNDNYLFYWIGSNFSGQGIMSKALKEISDDILNSGENKVFTHIQKENIASIRVAEKAGFFLEKEEVFDKDSGDEDIMLVFSKKK